MDGQAGAPGGAVGGRVGGRAGGGMFNIWEKQNFYIILRPRV